MTADIEAAITLAQQTPQYFHEGRNLSTDERAVILPQDTWKISLIKSLDPDTQELIYASLGPLHLPHYLGIQRNEWLAKELFLLGKRLGRPATMDDLMEDLRANRNPTRYRLCYALNFPLWTALSHLDHDGCRREVVEAFLALAEMLHPARYPYYSVLWRNQRLLASRN